MSQLDNHAQPYWTEDKHPHEKMNGLMAGFKGKTVEGGRCRLLVRLAQHMGLRSIASRTHVLFTRRAQHTYDEIQLNIGSGKSAEVAGNIFNQPHTRLNTNHFCTDFHN